MRKRKSRRIERLEVLLSPEVLERMAADRSAWHESSEEVEDGLARAAAWKRARERRMRWIRRQMAQRLTPRQRQCVKLHILQEMTLREVAKITGTHHSSVSQAVRRGVRRLKVLMI